MRLFCDLKPGSQNSPIEVNAIDSLPLAGGAAGSTWSLDLFFTHGLITFGPTAFRLYGLG